MGRPSKTSVQATSKERKLFKEKKNGSEKKRFNSRLKCSCWCWSQWTWNFSKKSKLAASHILTSPDVQKLKLSSPELAEFLTRNPTLATPTPSGGNYIFPKTVTEEQESYVKGFEVALKNLQHQEIPNQIITGSHVGLPSVIKSEPLTRTSIETIEKATAAHRASTAASSAKLVPIPSLPEVGKSFSIPEVGKSFSIPEVSPRPESSASGSMDSAELRIKEEMDDADLDQDDFDEEDSYSDEEMPKPAPKKGRGSKKITPINMESQEKI